MDATSAIWMAAQYCTKGLRNAVFSQNILRGYALIRGAAVDELDTYLDEAEGIFWRKSGASSTLKQMTSFGTAQLWIRYGKPSPRNKSPERQNATSRYFAHHFERFFPYAQAYLGRKLPRSAELGKVDDHIMGWITLAIERDYLAKYVERNVAPSLLCHFIYNKSCSDLRKDGRNPALRALHGALAPHEVQARSQDQVSWTERMIEAPPALGEDPLANLPDKSGQVDEFDLEAVSSLIAELLDKKFRGISLMELYECKYDQGLSITATAKQLKIAPELVQAGQKEVKRVLEQKRSVFRGMGVAA